MGKKQHFIPKFLLREFSPDQKRINVFYLPGHKVIYNVPLNNQAYEKNIYGDQIEDYLSRIESDASTIIRNITRNNNTILNIEDDIILKHFINLQMSRTPQQAETIDKMGNGLIKTAFRDDSRLKDKLKDLKFRMTSPYHSAMKIAYDITPFLFDLRVCLLINKTNIPFILGQHPSVIVNPFLFIRNWVGSKHGGVGAKGAVIILPVSPKYAIILMDRNRYSLRSFTSTEEVSPKDAEKLNALQFCYTTDCIYFNGNGANINFIKLNNETDTFRKGNKNIFRVYEGKYSNKRESEIIEVSCEAQPIRPDFFFLGIKERAIYEDLGQTMDILRDDLKPLREIIEKNRYGMNKGSNSSKFHLRNGKQYEP